MSLLPDFLRRSLNVIPGVNIQSQLVSDLGNPAAWLVDGLSGANRVLSGENVNGVTAMQLTAYFAAIRNISEDIAKLPVNIFELTENGKKQNNNHQAFGVLNVQTNPYVSSMAFYQTLIHWAISWGNGYAEIVRNGRGDVVEMWPIHPSRVMPLFDANDKLFYDISGRNTIQGQDFTHVRLSAENVYHLSGLGGDGIVGYILFNIAAQSVGIGLASQNCAASYYGNATSLSGVLENPNKLDKDAYKRMRKSWNDVHTGGAENKNKIAILEQGTKFTATQSNAQSAQLIESRRFAVEEMARLLRIPPHKIGSGAGMPKGNLESESVSYFRDTLTPWIERIKRETGRKIIKNNRLFARHQVDALTLGDSKTRAGVFKTHRNMGTMSINDVRDFESMNEIDEEWANEYHMQSNVTTVPNISEGANLKNGSGQNSGGKLEPGEEDTEGRDPEASAIDMFETAKKAHMPNFRAAARRIVVKESKAVSQQLQRKGHDVKAFAGWCENFFEKQKADIVDAFTPCCEVFLNTIAIENIEMELGVLVEFSDNYALHGIEQSLQMFEKQTKGEVIAENLEEDQIKMANSVLNMIGSTAKVKENETK
jgi:HK97 family phage portal protein